MRQGDSDLIAFGQLGSSFANLATTDVKPPAGKNIIAITFLADTKLDKLAAAGTDHLDASFNHDDAGAALADANGVAITNDTIFPKGITIYGKWTEVSITADNAAAGIICYFG
jgi:hypothetical protein|tara:strand:+ start:291 stop:629 length:339 start_codon:yes stop_codon:yes gene_type:complete